MCEGQNADCAKVDEYVKALARAMGDLKPDSDGYKKLKNVLDYLGDPNTANGAEIVAKSHLDPGGAGEDGKIHIDVAQIAGLARTVFGPVNTEMSPAALESGVGAAILAHEARHELDFQKLGFPRGKAEEYRTELNAYTTESSAYEGGNVFSHLWQPGMTPARRQELIAQYAQKSTDKWCSRQGGCK